MSLPSLRCLLALTGVCLLTFGLPAQAQWKWRDARGQVQYSDLPPPAGVAAKDILQRPSQNGLVPVPASVAAASAPAPAASAVDPALEAKRKQTEQAEADKRKNEEARIAQAKAQNCARAREYLRTLDSGQRIARTNAQGEREVLDEQARAREVQQARDVMASNCN